MIREEPAASTAAELEFALGSMPSDGPLQGSCSYVVSSPGKRFRAAVLTDAAAYGGETDRSRVEQAAVAVELFHSATLAHDDVVDDGQLRRGKPTIGAYAGNLAASLSGGWLFARSVELIAAFGPEATDRFARTAAWVCEGEMIETRDLHDVDRTRERYLETIEAKTGCLIAFAAWLGAEVGGADAETKDRLESYGRCIGFAFQIADDILDLVADPKATGKTPGSDLRQRVYTLPAIIAMAADPVLREALVRGPAEEDLPLLVNRIAATGAIETAFAECEAWVDRARQALPEADPGGGERDRLLALGGSILDRVEEMSRP